jgi:hypothetical protein
LATTTSRPQLGDAVAKSLRQSVVVADVRDRGDDASPLIAHEPGGLFQILRGGGRVTGLRDPGADVDGDHVRALARQPHGVRPAHTAGGPGDEDDLPLETTSHGDVLPV